jgi:hypothetical protein
MYFIALALNVVTLAIVGTFAFFIYLSYLNRPEPNIRPIDVMRDIVGGQSGHARIYKVAPFKTLLKGNTGSFVQNEDEDHSRLGGNMFDYVQGKKPWDGEKDANFGSRV